MRRLKGGLSLATLTLFAACNAILGNEDHYSLAPGAECQTSSECDDGKLCLLKTCSSVCLDDGDCEGARCLKTVLGAACVTPTSATCGTAGKTCPEGSVCRDRACRNECTGPIDCLTDQNCSAAGICVGIDVTRDPAASGGKSGTGGSGGAMGGAAGESAGGTDGGMSSSGGRPGTGGAPGSGGSSVSSGGVGDAGAGGSGGAEGGAPCVAKGIENCFNSLDDDCNGAVDCADAACQAPAVCVPSAPALGTFAPANGSCPAGYSAVALKRGFTAPPECLGCTCTPNETRCESGVYGHGPFTCPSYEFSGLLYNVYSSSCEELPADTKVHYYDVHGFTVCTAGGKGTPAPAQWTETRIFCKADRVGAGCAAGSSCVPKLTTAACSLTTGAASCGANYPQPSAPDPWYTGATDSRTCPACDCSFGTATCAGAYINAWSAPGCTGTQARLGNGVEGDACALPFIPRSGRVIGTPTAASCEPNTYVTGSATPTSPQTICCR